MFCRGVVNFLKIGKNFKNSCPTFNTGIVSIIEVSQNAAIAGKVHVMRGGGLVSDVDKREQLRRVVLALEEGRKGHKHKTVNKHNNSKRKTIKKQVSIDDRIKGASFASRQGCTP